jgi:hypothetical protein
MLTSAAGLGIMEVCSAAMMGGIVLARAVQDPRFSEEILRSVRQKLG